MDLGPQEFLFLVDCALVMTNKCELLDCSSSLVSFPSVRKSFKKPNSSQTHPQDQVVEMDLISNS